MNQCTYCGKKIDDVYYNYDDSKYCSETCKEKGIKFNQFAIKFKLLFLILILVCTCVITIGAFMPSSLIWVGIGVAMLAILIFVLPMATPQSIDSIGIRKSIIVCRILSIISLLLGFWMIFQ